MAKKAEKIAREARIACEKWREYFHTNILQYHLMHEFVLGHQWEQEEEDMLVTNKKIPLTSNKLATMANSLLGEQQQNTPQLQVIPMSNCDDEVAKIRELILKDIVFSTPAQTVYQVAASQSFIGGFGAFLVDTDYTHAKSFDQDIVFRHFKDASRCYWDIGADRVNKTDGMVGGFITRMTRTKFREVHGQELSDRILGSNKIVASKEEVALATSSDLAEDSFSWADDESVSILDHYVRKFEKDYLYKLSNGKILDQSEMDELIERSRAMVYEQQSMEMQPPLTMDNNAMSQGMQDMADTQTQSADNQFAGEQMPMKGGLQSMSSQVAEPETAAPEMEEDDGMVTLYDDGEMVRIEEKREIKRSKIIHYKIAGDYVLDKTEFAGEQIPVIYVDQNSYYDKDGKQICRSFFADCTDTQRYINYLRTQSAYILKISRYDQYIGSKKNVQGVDTQRNWKDPQAVQGLLAYDESPSGAKPEQVRPPELSQSLLTQYQLAVEDLYTSTGLYPARLGKEGNEVSGAAIDARTRQGSYTTYVAFNSINRAIAVGGEIVNEMIPKVYDAERVIALMTPEEGMKNITINKQSDEYGEHVENDIRKGTYEVRLKPGPSYEGQKQEALNSLQQVLQADPTSFKLVADLFADNLPLANNIEIKNRLKTVVPPEIIEAGKTGKMPYEMGQQGPSPEQQQMQMQQQQMQMQMQLNAKQLELKEQELQVKKQQIMMEAQFKIQELETDRLETAGKIEEQKLRYMAEAQRTESDAGIAHANNLVKILTHKVN